MEERGLPPAGGRLTPVQRANCVILRQPSGVFVRRFLNGLPPRRRAGRQSRRSEGGFRPSIGPRHRAQARYRLIEAATRRPGSGLGVGAGL